MFVAAAGTAGTAGADAATASDLFLRKEFKVTDYACQSLLILLTFPLHCTIPTVSSGGCMGTKTLILDDEEATCC
jgi:hypothetical protein